MTNPIDPATDGAHTDFADTMSYGDYLHLNPILNAQHPRSDAHDEMLFIIQHQTSELWMKLVIHELNSARDALNSGTLEPAFKMLARVARIFEQLNNAWDVLRMATPAVVVVDEEDRPVGIVSRTDLLRAHHDGRVDAGDCQRPAFDPGWVDAPLRAQDIMTPTPIVVTCSDSPQHVLGVLESSGVQQLPVTDEEGRVAGMLGSVGRGNVALTDAMGRGCVGSVTAIDFGSGCVGKETATDFGSGVVGSETVTTAAGGGGVACGAG